MNHLYSHCFMFLHSSCSDLEKKTKTWGTSAGETGGSLPCSPGRPEQALRKHEGPLCRGPCVVFLQELVVDEGIQHLDLDGWHLVCGKAAQDWRGQGIAFRADMGTRSSITVLHAFLCAALSILHGKLLLRLASVHIPHHATITQTEEILDALGGVVGGNKVVIGVDANETFERAERGERAQTGRGEAILRWKAVSGFNLPRQQLHKPTRFPYNPPIGLHPP